MTNYLPYPEKVHITSDAVIKDDVSIIALGDGYEQRAAKGINAQREEWNIVYPSLSQTELQSALSILRSVGAVSTMVWVSPLDGIEKKYVIVKDSRKMQKVSDKWRLSFSIRQVFEPWS
jgi:phage-related protein